MVTYNRDIPDAPNNPSVDQPKMKTNTNSIDEILAVDHISFNATNGGIHKQNTYQEFSAGTLTGGSAPSVAYPAAGVAAPTRAQYYFKNSTNNFLVSGVRAFALVTGATGAIIASQSSNITGIVRIGVGVYTVTVAANVLTTSNYMIFISAERTSSTSGSHSYTITSATTFDLFFNRITTGTAYDPITFTFAVIQI